MQPARITIRESITHQVMTAGDPTTFESRHTQGLQMKEQPYYRTKTIGTDWELVSLGWLDACSFLVLKNVWEFPPNPSPADMAHASTRVIDVVLGNHLSVIPSPMIAIPAGSSSRFSPMTSVWVRSRHDSETTISIIAFPR